MYVVPKKASQYYNVSENALRVWANNGKIKFNTTKGGHRRYFVPDSTNPDSSPAPSTINIIYTRVSSQKQKNDLFRQTEFLKQKYPSHHIISDVGSGINFERTGFKKILDGVFQRNIKEVVVAHRDRFSRFGYSLFEWIFQQHEARLVCDSTEESSENDELSEDLMAIVTVYSARYYGRRKYNKQILQESKILS